MTQQATFLRKATGLVRAWSVYDAFIYSFFSINLITLGLYIFSFGIWWPTGHLIPAILLSAVFIAFEIVVYASLISVMPRAGGDYVWQSRVLGGFWGYVLGLTGWVFILWHWVPIYGQILVYEFFTPMLVVGGHASASADIVNSGVWFTTSNGLFTASMVVVAFAFFYIAIGMKWYARIQKWCFHIGMLGLLTMLALLAVSSNADFVAAFNKNIPAIFGYNSPTAFEDTLKQATANGYTPQAFTDMNLGASEALIPLIVFFNLWPNWGATLYGEVRGASDFKRNLKGMMSALIATTILALILLGLIAKTMTWEFYNSANYAFWMYYYAYTGASPMPVWPYPGLLTAFLTDNPALQLWLIGSLSLWFWGWSGTVFMSSTRCMFACAFDRVLPAWIGSVSTRFKTPINALILMALPSIPIAYLYSFTPFWKYTLDATVVIAVMYLGTAIAATLLPYRKPELFKGSPVAKYKVGGVPLLTVSGVIFALFVLYLIVRWIQDPLYGVNDPKSAIYMLGLYVLAIVLFVGFKSYRKSQGVDVNLLYREIPVE